MSTVHFGMTVASTWWLKTTTGEHGLRQGKLLVFKKGGQNLPWPSSPWSEDVLPLPLPPFASAVFRSSACPVRAGLENYKVAKFSPRDFFLAKQTSGEVPPPPPPRAMQGNDQRSFFPVESTHECAQDRLAVNQNNPHTESPCPERPQYRFLAPEGPHAEEHLGQCSHGHRSRAHTHVPLSTHDS